MLYIKQTFAWTLKAGDYIAYTLMSFPIASESPVKCSHGPQPSVKTAFTLIELLVVISIMAILIALGAANIPGLMGAQSVTGNGYALADLLEAARTFALANNTYVWVGFFEEDGSQPSQTPAVSGTGRVIISVVASPSGTRYNENSITGTLPAAFGAGAPSNIVSLIQLNKVVRLNNSHLVANNGSAQPVRPIVPLAYQVGDIAGQAPKNATGAFALHVGSPSGNPTTFTYPLVPGASPAQYSFAKIIEFNSQGEASKIDENVISGPGPQGAMEIALQPTHGSAISPAYSGANQNKAAIAIQVQGLTGQVRVYRL